MAGENIITAIDLCCQKARAAALEEAAKLCEEATAALGDPQIDHYYRNRLKIYKRATRGQEGG